MYSNNIDTNVLQMIRMLFLMYVSELLFLNIRSPQMLLNLTQYNIMITYVFFCEQHTQHKHQT